MGIRVRFTGGEDKKASGKRKIVGVERKYKRGAVYDLSPIEAHRLVSSDSDFERVFPDDPDYEKVVEIEVSK